MTEMVRAEAGALAVRLDPQALLMEAVKGGAGIDTLERIMALAERCQANEAKQAFHQAIMNFQHECPALKKTKTADIATRSGSRYKYSYAPLDEILPIIRPIMAKHGLSNSWEHSVEGDHLITDCVISHVLGHEKRSGKVSMPIGVGDGRMNPAQAVGSVITYGKRYTLLSGLGLSPEDDDDAHAQDSATVDKDTGEVMDEAPRLPKCPQCGKDGAVMAGKVEYGGGWLCFKKKGGCGHKWQDAPATVTSVAAGEGFTLMNEPSAFDQNIEDRRRLIEQIGVDRKYMGLTDAQWTVMWAKTVGPNVSEQAAPLDKLVALGANLADKVSDMKREQA
jgi:hypothetical protein